MKISIITVCLNAKNTIEKMFESLNNQTYKNIEHIIIDGVSSDGTLDIIEKHKAKISHFISEPDSGIYNAMNKGLKYVTGDVVYFLNATDALYNDNILETVAKEFEKHPDLEILWGDVEFINQDGSPRIHENGNYKTKSDFIYNNPCHQCIFYKSGLFKKYGNYDESIKIYGDYDLNVRMIVKNDAKCKYIPEILASFELGGVSTSADEKIKSTQKKDIKTVYEKNFKDKFHFRADKFFTKTFGSITRKVKKTFLWEKLFNLADKTSQKLFNDRLSLNIISKK